MRTEESAAPLHHARGSAPRPRARSLSVLLAAAIAIGAFFALAAPALAARSAETPIAGFTTPQGLTVDGSNNVWVSDTGTSKVSVFNTARTLLHENDGTGSWAGSPNIESLAFSAAAAEVFVADSNHDDLWGLDPADASYTGTDLNSGLGSGCCYIKVAADNSPGATGGDLYLPSHLQTPKVLRIDGAGAADPFSFSASYISGNELTGTGTEAFSEPAGAAVNGSGDLFVADQGTKKVYEFAPSGEFLAAFTEAGGSPFESVAAVAIDPTTENVLIADGTAGKVDEFTSVGSFVESTSVTGAAGLAVDSTGRLYVISGTEVDVFSSAGPPPVQQPLVIEVQGEGEVTGTGIACTQAGNGTASCEEEFAEGSEVPLSAAANPGSSFVGWTTVEGDAGTCTGATASCETGELEEPTKLKAEFVANPSFPVEVAVTGEGEVTAPGITCTEAGNGTAACEEEFAEGSLVTLHASPETGWKFEGWTGIACNGGNATTTCAFTMPNAPVSVSAEFEEVTTSPLTVFVTGEGEVNSSPAGITGCTETGGTCTELFEGTVTLTESAETGYVFAGWIGCKHKSATECEVTVNAEKEVYAVFLKEGTQGAPGTPGETPTITTLPVGNVHCPNGGLEVTLGASHTFLCNGTNGSNGSNGSNGTNGATGPQGPAGAAGKDGAQGPAGATGPQGPAGPAAKVTCKVKNQSKSKVKVTCTVKQGASASSARLGWRLSRNGQTVRHGLTDRGSSRLDLSGLTAGRYLLHVKGHRNAVIVID